MFGIDYGARYAGTTVIAAQSGDGGEVAFDASAKKQDADRFILDYFSGNPPATIFFDAPLSLPIVYSTPDHPEADYFYRACDKALGAMSPMFLGGLTARAMSLAVQLRQMGHIVVETYPGALARKMELKQLGYKTKASEISVCVKSLISQIELDVDVASVKSWHHFDALLALCSALRHVSNTAESFGSAMEGLIVV
jgi:predicted nuclease with RNAse H fold